ncbi:MAG: ROK family protein [Spirochaetaceae bacterium]|jgi:predicted NBD/HSP70 family sugar kinase|nr:ROK family protein [Spirochaetaceae bacterium]
MGIPITDSIIQSRKRYRRNRVLDIIRTNAGVSRYEIKKITSYSIETILGIIDELLEEELICEEARSGSQIGRRPISLFINSRGGYFVGIEFNSRRIQGVMLNFAKEQVHSEMLPVSADDDAVALLEKVETVIEQVLSALPPGGKKVLGIGLGLPGFYDPETGVAISYDFLPSWKNIPIKKIIQDRFKLPCFIENNVAVIAMAYRWLMFQEKPEDFLFVSIRTGVRIVPCYGGRFIFEGKNYVGQLGHVKVPGSNRLCGCGERGCLNAEISDPGIRNKMIEMVLNNRLGGIVHHENLKDLTIDVLKDMVTRQDHDAIELVEDSAVKLGHCLGIMADILAPSVIVLSGTLVSLGDLFMNAVEKGIRQNTINGCASKMRLINSTLGDNAGAWGAAVLVLLRLFDFETMQI